MLYKRFNFCNMEYIFDFFTIKSPHKSDIQSCIFDL